jgi:hypothetical protein
MAHQDLADVLPALKRTSAKGASLTEQVQCSLCAKGLPLKSLQKHMASHQQQLSLFALPPNLDETEDDHDEDNENSISPQDEETGGRTSDLSDTAEDEVHDNWKLQIHWGLFTGEHFWQFLDDKLYQSNTEQPSSIAFQDQHSWTEILASQVSRDVIKEVGLPYTFVLNHGSGNQMLEYVKIKQALQYPQVRSLVERTLERSEAIQDKNIEHTMQRTDPKEDVSDKLNEVSPCYI